MFPLRVKSLIRGCKGHIKAGLGCAGDYRARYVPYYAPFKGSVYTFQEDLGGNWIGLRRGNGDRIECAHISSYVRKYGQVNEGDLIAYTGNSGDLTSGPHAHIQIIRKGVRLDPEQYDWEVQRGINVRALFSQIWKRPPARGEELYFLKRVEKGTIKDTKADIMDKMKYWYSVVYPQGKLSVIGNARWQYEKFKVLVGHD